MASTSLKTFEAPKTIPRISKTEKGKDKDITEQQAKFFKRKVFILVLNIFLLIESHNKTAIFLGIFIL